MPLSLLSEIEAVTTWEIIEEALAHRRPRRSPQWLADQLRVTIQVVSNWKGRGRVPANRLRDIATVLGLSIDQLEGLEPPPWEEATTTAGLSPKVTELASAVDQLPPKWHAWALQNMREVLIVAQQAAQVNGSGVTQTGSSLDESQQPETVRRLKK